jgi:DNA-binding response OmpR family regulator
MLTDANARHPGTPLDCILPSANNFLIMSEPDPLRILVVDDERPLADSLAQIFQLSGFVVSTCYDGASAIARAATFRPDIVVSDYSMPGLNGLEASAKIKALLPGCRIIMLSAHSLPHEAEPHDPSDYLSLQKPMHPSEILSVINGEAQFPEVTTHLRVLNVDDVEPHRYSLSRLFRRAGFEVTEASTVSEALLSAIQMRPDLALLDVHLPDGNGFDLCATLRRNPETAQITVVHVTSSATNEESRNLSRVSGADDYVPYPIDPKKLVSRSRELLQLRYLRDTAV